MEPIEVDDETRAQIDAEAAARGTSPAAVVAEAVRLLLKRHAPEHDAED